jgi:hypothetical protein
MILDNVRRLSDLMVSKVLLSSAESLLEPLLVDYLRGRTSFFVVLSFGTG